MVYQADRGSARLLNTIKTCPRDLGCRSNLFSVTLLASPWVFQIWPYYQLSLARFPYLIEHLVLDVYCRYRKLNDENDERRAKTSTPKENARPIRANLFHWRALNITSQELMDKTHELMLDIDEHKEA